MQEKEEVMQEKEEVMQEKEEVMQEKEEAEEAAEFVYREAVHLYYGLNGTRMDREGAISCYQRAMDLGHDGALAICLVNGWGVHKQLHKGLALLALRSDAGDAAAKNTLAGHHYQGWGYSPDSTRAAALFRDAADRGFVPALANLSYLTRVGRGVDENQQLAFQRLSDAAKDRYPLALAELGRAYAQGKPAIGLAKNEWLALRCFQAAAHGGSAVAETNYQDLVLRTLVNAVEWRDTAALTHYLDAFLYKTKEDVTSLLGKPVNVRGETLLHHAAEIRHTECLKVFIEAVHDIREVRDGDTIIHAAARGGNALGIALLLKHDADPMAKCELQEQTALHHAVQAAEESAAATRAILDTVSKAKRSHELVIRVVNARDLGMQTPLHCALVGRGRETRSTIDCVHQLLRARANPNALDQRGYSPLLLAKRTDKVACARLLLIAGAEPLIGEFDKQERLARRPMLRHSVVDNVFREWEHRRHCLLRQRLALLIGAQQAQHPLFGLLPRELVYAIVRYTWHDPPIRTTLLPV